MGAVLLVTYTYTFIVYLFLHVWTSVTFKVLCIWCSTPTETFSHCSKEFSNLSILMPFSGSAGFLFHLFHIGKMLPCEDFFHPGKQKKKKSCLGQDWVTKEGEARGSCSFFGQKLMNTQRGVGRCAYKSPTMKWANSVKESSKTIHWSQTQPLTTTPAGTLFQMGSLNTHLAGGSLHSKGPALQKINLGFLGSPLICILACHQTPTRAGTE